MTDTQSNNEVTETTIVSVSPETNALVEKEMAGESDQLKQETKALVEAIKKRAQSEIENAQTLTKDAYLNAIRSAKEAVENHKWVDRQRIEHSVELLQKDAQENWQKIVDEISDLGDRLQEAAQAAWDILIGKNSGETK
jgi:F0F1-type ATP synthase membrane subunit b/b'